MEALLPYYERELAFLRRYSREFAERYPKIAARLAPVGEHGDDPHVERMIESFALLGARVHKKLDDEYPEFAEALFEVLYPHYLRPFPACSIAQFGEADALGLATSVTLPRGTALTTREVRGVRCRFRTTADVTLAPVRIASARHVALGELGANAAVLPGNAAAVLSLTFETTGEPDFTALKLAALRAYLHGEQSFIAALSDALFVNALSAYVEVDNGRGPGPWRPLDAVPIGSAGFEDTEPLIDYPAKSHPGYRLLTEYFAFPEKFNFISFDFAAMRAVTGRCRRFTLHIVIGESRNESNTARLVETLAAHHLRLFCAPVVNLFAQRGEPIRVSHEAASYAVIGDARNAHAYDVYSIDAVHLVKEHGDRQTVTELRPFYSLHHDEAARTGRYWYARRNAWVAENSPGYETEISVVDTAFEPGDPQTDTLSLALTCTNRNLPSRLAIGLDGGDLFADDAALQAPIAMLCRPTQTVRVERGAAMYWRLVAHLALNHVSLAGDGLAPLKELLVLYDVRRTPVSARHIEGIVDIETRPAVHWLTGAPFATFVRGQEVRLTFDETHFVGTSLSTFVRMLDTFFGLYVHLNSFVQLVALSKRTGEEIMRCKPRSAESTLA